jgi:hypothetical protein
MNKEKKTTEALPEYGKKLIEWEFPEYIKYQRSRKWFIGLGLIEFLAIIYAILTQNFLFGILMILIGFILILHSKREPLKITFQIFETGIKVGSKFYKWDQLNNFRIVYEPSGPKLLYFDVKGTLIPDFSIPLENQNPLEVRQILKKYLAEDLEKKYDTLTDKLNRWLRL